MALDAGFLNEEEFGKLTGLATQVGALLYGLMRYLRESELKGYKLRESADRYLTFDDQLETNEQRSSS